MKKSDLRLGMKIELRGKAQRGGNQYIAYPPDTLISMKTGFLDLSTYDDNLNYIPKINNSPWDIMKVYVHDSLNNWKLLWERSDKIEMSINVGAKDLGIHGVPVKVIVENLKTTVILPDGTQSSTICLPEDTYNQFKGIEIASNKAMIKYYSKKLKQLNK